MSNQEAVGFDSGAYFEQQMAEFSLRIDIEQQSIVEFGGKPFGDHHAARVLPGYDPDIKARIIHGLVELDPTAQVVMAVNARDLLLEPDGRRVAKRIRGDSALTYDDEVLRLADQAATDFDIDIRGAALTVVPSSMTSENEDFIGEYTQRLRDNFNVVRTLPMIDGYPNSIPSDRLVSSLTRERGFGESGQSVIIISPGGGSGKFGVAISEIAHSLRQGYVPNFIKFETFPVFRMAIDHPLNLAFLAATADLPNELRSLSNGQTNYDKDIENLALLQQLLSLYTELDTSNLAFERPTDMGVNVIDEGITDMSVVEEASRNEITARMRRYQGEIRSGKERPETLERVGDYVIRLAAS